MAKVDVETDGLEVEDDEEYQLVEVEELVTLPVTGVAVEPISVTDVHLSTH